MYWDIEVLIQEQATLNIMPTIDLLLVSPPSRMINHYRPPLSLMYVAQHFKEKALEVKIVDVPMREVVRTKAFFNGREAQIEVVRNAMLEQIASVRTKEIGITCYSPEFDEVVEFIKQIRTISKAKIGVGGIHPTFCPNDFKGLVDKVYEGRYDTKFPAYELVNMAYYTNANPYAIRGVYLRSAYVLSSMGCPSQCTFCVAKKLRNYYGVGYIKSPAELAKEVVWLKNTYGIDGFYVIDDLFTISKEFVSEFCGYVKDSGLLWACSSKVPTLTHKLISTMAKSGCIQIDFGVERGSNEALQRIKKGQTVEQVKEVFQWCREEKVRTFANFIINIPGETNQDRTNIGTFIRSIKPTITSVNVYRGYYGTELPDQVPTKEVEQCAVRLNRRSNSIFNNLQMASWRRYLSILFRSKKKLNYLKQLLVLIKEIINQCI